ncbi:MAG TPA: hypothetical protein VK422_17350 [Pyrinomonadaceae bacterium]|nr:hypothetical protein [Pyrinomonadaceae bacterium]
MEELIHLHTQQVEDASGVRYEVRVCGEAREDGTWEGWIEFHPADGRAAPVLRTGRETTQPNRQALVYWASGLEPLYMEGALSRAS